MLREVPLVSPREEDRDVLAGNCADAFVGSAVGVEVPEAGVHGDGVTAYRVPLSGEVSENAARQRLNDALLSSGCDGFGHPHPGSAASRCKGGCRRKAQSRRLLLAEGTEKRRQHPVPLPVDQRFSGQEEREV